ncbi:MAG: hypothetical protein J7M13_06010 [Synergistetes bacterium]|nr:hypothetical protein [Synergistota bacterium]
MTLNNALNILLSIKTAWALSSAASAAGEEKDLTLIERLGLKLSYTLLALAIGISILLIWMYRKYSKREKRKIFQ